MAKWDHAFDTPYIKSVDRCTKMVPVHVHRVQPPPHSASLILQAVPLPFVCSRQTELLSTDCGCCRASVTAGMRAVIIIWADTKYGHVQGGRGVF